MQGCGTDVAAVCVLAQLVNKAASCAASTAVRKNWLIGLLREHVGVQPFALKVVHVSSWRSRGRREVAGGRRTHASSAGPGEGNTRLERSHCVDDGLVSFPPPTVASAGCRSNV
jgi:hypothetical protein